MKTEQFKWLSASALSVLLAACGGGGSDSRPELPGAPSSAASSAPSSAPASSSGSSSSAGGSPDGVILHETFDVVDSAEFFSPGYKPLPGAANDDPHPAMYFPIAGFELDPDPENPVDPRILVGEGKLTITSSSRFSIGQHYLVRAGATPPNGEWREGTTTGFDSGALGVFDLSQPWKISFCLVNVTTGDANSKLELYVDNNTSGLANSRLGNNNRILSVATESYVSHVGSRVEVSVPGGAMPVPDRTNTAMSEATQSFLQFRVSGATGQSTVTISDLWIGLQSAAAPTDCEAGDHLNLNPPAAAPAAPTITAGDSQLTVTWEAVDRASGYDVAWNTTATPPTEASQIFSVSGLERVITGLNNGTTYYVFVRAKNAGGVTGWSASTSSVPVPASVVPDAPVGLTATPGNTQVEISWTVDTSATAYQVAYNTTATPPASASADWVEPSGEGSHTFTGLTNDLEYHFFVRAENSAGYSEVVSVTATPEDLSGASSNRQWLFDADSYAIYADEPDFLGAAGSTRSINQADPAKSVNGLTFFKTDTGASIRMRDPSGIINFNGSSFTSNNRVINADVDGKLDQPLRNYVGVFVTPGEAVTVSFTWKQTSSSVSPSKVGLIDDANTLLVAEDAIDGATGTITISLPASHTSSEVRFFYSRENNTSNGGSATGGIDLSEITRQYN